MQSLILLVLANGCAGGWCRIIQNHFVHPESYLSETSIHGLCYKTKSNICNTLFRASRHYPSLLSLLRRVRCRFYPSIRYFVPKPLHLLCGCMALSFRVFLVFCHKHAVALN